MKYKFIPVNNDLKKAVAFANTLDSNFIKTNQKIIQKPFYIDSLDAVRSFQKEGWKLEGVSEQRGKNRKISSHYLQMQHPDFAVLDTKGKTEAVPTITIENSCSGNQPLSMHLGIFRLVCSNGAVRKETVAEQTIKHIEANKLNFGRFVNVINENSRVMLNEVNKLKQRILSPLEMSEFAYQAAKLRYQDLNGINTDDFLKVNRNEDRGEDVWTVFNRIQESLTHNVSDFADDIRLNQKIYELTEQFV